ncbi:MAG: DUF924 family protein [Pseudomonadota bacterium]
MHREILRFWFEEIDHSQWWAKDGDFDKLIIERFADIHASATRCELFEWRVNAQGRLAEIIVLDQLSRNMFRGSPFSFAQDSLALALAQEAVSAKADKALSPIERNFLYMPFMHSESLKIHEVAMDLFRNNGIQSSLDFEIRHKRIIERFGRYSHRNSILGRVSTAEEIEFLKQPGSGF